MGLIGESLSTQIKKIDKNASFLDNAKKYHGWGVDPNVWKKLKRSRKHPYQHVLFFYAFSFLSGNYTCLNANYSIVFFNPIKSSCIVQDNSNYRITLFPFLFKTGPNLVVPGGM